MPELQTIALFMIAALALNFAPGPDMLYVIALFFLAFLPQFIDPGRGSPALQVIVLGLLFNTSGTLVNLGVAVLSSGATGWLRRRERGARALQRVTGAIFIALGVRLAVAGRR